MQTIQIFQFKWKIVIIARLRVKDQFHLPLNLKTRDMRFVVYLWMFMDFWRSFNPKNCLMESYHKDLDSINSDIRFIVWKLTTREMKISVCHIIGRYYHSLISFYKVLCMSQILFLTKIESIKGNFNVDCLDVLYRD